MKSVTGVKTQAKDGIHVITLYVNSISAVSLNSFSERKREK